PRSRPRPRGDRPLVSAFARGREAAIARGRWGSLRSPMTDPSTIRTETRGHVLLIGLNRPQKLNAFNEGMLRALADAYTRYEADHELRCAVLFAAGKDFTAGLDLASVMPGIEAGGPPR